MDVAQGVLLNCPVPVSDGHVVFAQLCQLKEQIVLQLLCLP